MKAPKHARQCDSCDRCMWVVVMVVEKGDEEVEGKGGRTITSCLILIF